MSKELTMFWEYEKKLEDIASPHGWSVDEMLDFHRHELDFKDSVEVHNILKIQVKLLRVTHPHLEKVIPVNFTTKGKQYVEK